MHFYDSTRLTCRIGDYMIYGPASFYEAGSKAVKTIRRNEIFRKEGRPVEPAPEPLPTNISEAIMSLKDHTNAPRLEAIIEAVCVVTGISFRAFMSPRREVPIVDARMIYYKLAKLLTSKSYNQIAKACGKADHTTIINGCKRIEQKPWLEPVVKEVMGKLVTA